MQKYPKLIFLAILSKNSIVKYPTKKLTIVVNRIVKMSKVPKIEPSFNTISTNIEAIATGTDIKKLNLRASSWSYFSNKIAPIVMPERDIPGRIETPWAKPDKKLSFCILLLEISITFLLPIIFLVAINITPVINNKPEIKRVITSP